MLEGLDYLPSLKVLMLGMNRIRKLQNLHGLPLLDVLDLHHNQITNVEGLEQLSSLRVLNLAGNQIVEVGFANRWCGLPLVFIKLKLPMMPSR